MTRGSVARVAAWVLVVLLVACRDGAPAGPHAPSRSRTQLVLAMQPLWGPAGPFDALVEDFERTHAGIDVVIRTLPNASDLAHQAFLTALQGGATDPDVFVVDTVWVAEFARAGWLVDLEGHFPLQQMREALLPGPVEAATWNGRPWAVPWFVDVGLLYRRTDLVPEAPRTYAELERTARAAMARTPGLMGYVWQGRQYEGLTCNALEAIWGHGGSTGRGDRVQLTGAPAEAGLAWLRHAVTSGLSPPSVTSAGEEEARRIFQQGRAVYMRNWPYAWSEAQKRGSPIRGRVGVSALPTVDGTPGPGALGGWLLAVNAHSPPSRREAALALLSHLTSERAAIMLAVDYARIPARRAVYAHPEVRTRAPFIASLRPHVERARSRPVTPYYSLMADAVQGSLSAAVTGVQTPAEALAEGQRLVDALVGEETR